jgi:hypothetical protein
MELDQLFSALALVVPPHSAALVSGPVASGQRFFLESGQADENDIWEANARNMDAFASDLRRRLGRLVICPSRFRIPGWRGSQYGEFFTAVIRRYVAEAWFVDGWEFSVGSVDEFGLCQKLHIPCYRSNGELLTHDAGLRLVEAALEQARKRAAATNLLEAALARLRLPQ